MLNPKTGKYDGISSVYRIKMASAYVVDPDKPMDIPKLALDEEPIEAPDGMAGLELARTQLPHLLIIDWEMPVIDGAQLVRMIRTPGEFPAPDVPIIMLSAHSDHRRVVESARIGANEFVRKPVSIKTLEDRILAVINRPRPTVKLDGYYGPMPRRLVPLEIFDGATTKS
jgi:DNA-binding response OmpR family regulator